MAAIPPPDFTADEGLAEISGQGSERPKRPLAGVGSKRDSSGAPRYEFGRALKFIKDANPELQDELEVMRLFSAGGAVELIYTLPPWTYVQYPSPEEANQAFFVLDEQCVVRSLFRTDELLDQTNAPSYNALGGALNINRGFNGHREGMGGGGDHRHRGFGLGYEGGGPRDRSGPPRLRTDHDFYKQLKFKSSANGQLTHDDVRRIFGGAGRVTKVYQLGPWTFVEFPSSEDANKAWQVMSKRNEVRQLFRTNELIDSLKKIHLKALRELAGIDTPEDMEEGGMMMMSGGFRGMRGGFGGRGGGFGGGGRSSSLGNGYDVGYDLGMAMEAKRRRMDTMYPMPRAYGMNRVPPIEGLAHCSVDPDVTALQGALNPFDQPSADLLMGSNYSPAGPAGHGTKSGKFPFEKQLKFKTGDNGNMDERKVRQLFEFGGFKVIKVAELGTWTFVEYPTSEDAEKAFTVMKKHNFVAGLQRTQQLRDFVRRSKDKVILKFKAEDNPTLTERSKITEIFSNPGPVKRIFEKEEEGVKWFCVEYVNDADSQKAFAAIDGWEYNGEDSVKFLDKEVANNFVDPDEPKMPTEQIGGGGKGFGGGSSIGIGGGGGGGGGGFAGGNSSRSGRYAFERQLKFKTDMNRNLSEEQLRVLFSAGGMLVVTKIYQLGPWTFVEYPTSEAANKGFEAVSKTNYFRMNSLFRTNELITHLRASGGNGGDSASVTPSHRERPPGGRERYPFERQLKFRTAENPVLTANYESDYNRVKELFTGGGSVTKVYELGPWTFVEYPTMEEADKAFDVLFPQKIVQGLFRTNEMILALRQARGQTGLYEEPPDPYASGQTYITGPSTLTCADGEYVGWSGKDDDNDNDEGDDDDAPGTSESAVTLPPPAPPGVVGNEDERQSLENPNDPMNKPLQFQKDFSTDRKGKRFVKDKPARHMPY